MALTQPRQHAERIKAGGTQFADPGAVHEFAGEVEVHTRLDASVQCLHRTEQVVPGVAIGRTGGQHRPGQHYRHLEAQQQEAQGRSAVGEGVGAMQDQYRVTAILLDAGPNGLNHRQPVGLVHVGAVDGR